ncbi:hypothetical protein NA57DRAFT_38036 [Rhizodiscina lignyota]|uniref:Transcription initiation factor TFIID subunit 1 histone acetyltransferase domain-containing protein n=1 Tax=Rhizodiscina lignyota TaxID=1504668 RepID=A0A9P4IHF7_9PEZI|nr:hypothetical protein NA57DRAFT_38036 [Rhizodiscina lignyota]
MQPGESLNIPGLDPDRPLDIGEKADDAVDYEDFSDDDLPDEEETPGTNDVLTNGHAHTEVEHSTYDAGQEYEHEERYMDDPDFDDLFGDGAPISSQRIQLPGASPLEDTPVFEGTDYVQDEHEDEEEEEEEDELVREQRALFARAGKPHEEGQEEQEDTSEIMATLWPQFDQDEVARFARLFPQKRAFYVSKAPPKPPKPIQPSKVSFELLQDQAKTFTLTYSGATQRVDPQELERCGLIRTVGPENEEEEQNQEVELDEYDENEKIGNITMKDLAILCEDWDVDRSSSEAGSPPDMTEVSPGSVEATSPSKRHADPADWLVPPKRRRIGERATSESLPIYYETFPSLDDPEATNAILSRRVTLDLNDPRMLIDIQQPDSVQAKAPKPGGEFRKDVNGSFTKSLNRRYNISNDDAYDLLKENHSHKIRSTLSNLTVEHSLPAIKLQYPFYKVKLSARDARSFHRPGLSFKPQGIIKFNKRESKKRKIQRSLAIQQAFDSSKELSLNDNADISLFEYSEEYPMMMSNFGMGSRLVNYYRRKDEEDTSRPKYEWGDTHVLLPQDKSPFSIFGNIAPGEHQPTLHNTMYRAPVWQHSPKGTDFVVGRSTTGMGGQQYYLRNMQNLYVVGQQLPSVEVPGTHSRKVTDAAKKRLKMISWRIYQKHQNDPRRNPPLTNDIIKEHLPGSEIPQNRSKMREFMSYDRDHQVWVPGPKDGKEIPPPDYAGIRRQLKPDEICLLDSMQVGHRHLLDAGYNEDGQNTANNADDGDGGDKEDESLEQQLAPWQLTKNFLNACQSKAMLQLHGAGDPSGRGEAFSFIKTSMKGGFKAQGESVQATIDKVRQKQLGGHSYNVAQQQKDYEEAIRKIWESQKRSLEATTQPGENPEDPDADLDIGHEEDGHDSFMPGRTPRSDFGTPAAFSRREDDSVSQFSRFSANSQKGRVLKIIRHQHDKFGKLERVEEVVNDPKIIRAYVKAKKERERSGITIDQAAPTGDAERDALQRKMLEDELNRLERNKDRRHVREKAKGLHNGSATSPGTPGSPSTGGSKTAGTQRKCANCGMVGHIKTNKKLCPMLNGTMKSGGEFDGSAFGSTSTPVAQTPGGSAFETSPTGTMPPPSAFSP